MLEFQKGDKTSFEKLMERNFKKVFNLIYRFVNSQEVAEDLTQEVFLKIYKAGPTYQPQSKFLTWVYQIARNISLNELRKKNPVSLDQTMDSEDGEYQKEYADTRTQNPFQKVSQEEIQSMIREAVASLPENQRMAVLLKRYENFSYEEIAETLDCSVKAVKSLLNRAKENLKEKLLGLMED